MVVNWRIGLFLAGLIAVLMVTALTTRIETDISAFVVSGDNAREARLASEMQSGALSRRLLLSVTAPQNRVVPEALVDALIRKWSGIDGVIDVWRPEQTRVAMDSIQSLYTGYGANLYSLNPEKDLERLLSVKGLEQRAELLKKALLSPHGSQLKKIAIADPLLLLLDGFRSFSDRLTRHPDTVRVHQNVILETAASGLDVATQTRIQGEVSRIFDGLSFEGYGLEMTGVPVYASVTQALIQEDINRISLLSSVMVTVLFIAVFRSFLSLLQVGLVLIAVVSISVLVTGQVFGYVHGMTLAIGSTLIGVCIDYPIHALAHARSGDRTDRARQIAKIWPSMLLGGMTTVIGYGALGFSGYPGFQQIAVYAATGIIAALLLTRFVLPWMLSTSMDDQIRVPGVGHWAEFCIRHRQGASALLILLLLASVFHLDRLNWVDDLEKLTPELNELKERDRRIRSRMVSVEPGRFVLVNGKDTESALKRAEQVYSVLDTLKHQGDLADYFGLYPWLLSAELQRENHRLLNARLTSEVRETWREALKKQGLSVAKLGNLDYSDFDLLGRDRVLESPVRRLIDHQIIEHRDRTLIMVWIGKHSADRMREALQGIEDVQYFSQRDMLNELALSYLERAKAMLGLAFASIFVLLWLRYRSFLVTLKTLLPALLSAYIILAIWSSFQVALSFLHLIGFILVVAICVDYGIFYQENRGSDIAKTYQAIAASMLTSGAAFGSLVIAQTSTLNTLAVVVSLGLLFGFLLCPLIIHPLGSRVAKR